MDKNIIKSGAENQAQDRRYNNLMTERKVWGEKEDKILKYLKQERGERKWATIARIMQQEFDIPGRTGKQCRERYHNHLDANIVSSGWTEQEEELLFELHGEMGNKWSLIALKLPGRADNCVKNHFYSKLRKALRKLNKIIEEYFPNEFSIIKTSILSQVIQITESKFKMNSKIDQELADFCNGIKNRLFKFQYTDGEPIEEQTLVEAKSLIQDIDSLGKDFNKGHKSTKRQNQKLYRTYLKPPMAKKSSQNSGSSQNSDENSSILQSSSLVSSCSDLSQYDQVEKKKPASKSTGPRSQGQFSRHNSDRELIPSDDNDRVHYNKPERQTQKNGKLVMQVQNFEQVHSWLVQEQPQNHELKQFHYNDMFDESPLMARILGPPMDQEPNLLFSRKRSSDDEDIQFKEEHD